ncbi:ferrochelatase [Stenotrophomonas sp. Betaine-02u-21]|uniref:ferrochelatase n=1 Tax=unclassified Stenotrophomonas TaxID=196198 RepID=UPI000C34BBD6|nr:MULTISPECIES: ferrochelatase [unclassified Stenotrophomonas]PKH73874.1 ferrochelatase [Stenotrophomonas sp. Betaine-02u-21]PKH76306.1 ferrochelatase [Stenotrophomonas sp. Betaine-02u-23]PKH96498.1 ferrochelatase [Stenotrophomonas sp. Bg11-02]
MLNAPDSAVLAVNLGTPEAPTAPAVRRYLAEFLSDPRVVAIPALFWKPLLYGVILPLRSGRSAEKYAQVWLPGGSPLMVHTRNLAEAMQRLMPSRRVRHAMRYGVPALGKELDDAKAAGIRRIAVLPLYPQYSTTTTASVEDLVERWRRKNPDVQVELIRDYPVHPAWVDAVAGSIRRWWEQHGRGEKLMFSFHGIPQRVADAGDPYPRQCEASAAAIAAALGLSADQWQMGYQSRFGREKWLQPYAEPSLWALAEGGVKQIDVVCPGFATDCLETLEEVALGFTHTLAERGAQMRYIPCLNDDPAHAGALAQLAEDALK